MFEGNKRYLNKVFINERFFFFSKLMNWRANDRISYRIHFFLLYYNRMHQSKSNDSLSYSSPSTLISSARLKTIMLVALVYSFFFIDRRYDDVRWSIIISNWTVKNKFRFARIKLKISEKKKMYIFSSFVCFSNSPRSFASPSFFFCNKLKSFTTRKRFIAAPPFHPFK